METITHLLKDENAWDKGTRCGQKPNCTDLIPTPVHHCFTTDINKVSCADCADHYAEQHIKQNNLDTAFKIIAAKDNEIAQLERENKQLKETVHKMNEEFRKYQNSIIDGIMNLINNI